MIDIERWWASLTVADKERIAGKLSGSSVKYPGCTAVWQSLSEEHKTQIYLHCSDKHGNVLKEWFEGNPFTD